MRDPVRLHGTIQEPTDPRRAFRRVTLVVEGKTAATIDEGEIEFALFEGGMVTIEVPAEGTELIDPIVTVVKGAWSELRELPQAERLARNAVTPFTEVELHTATAPAGETVEVYGEAFEHELDETASTLREAKKRPSRVLAKIVAFGRSDEAMSAMRDAISKLLEVRVAEQRQEAAPPPPAKKPREPWAVWLPLGVLGSIAILVAALAVSATASLRWNMELVALVFAALALVLRPTPDVPEFRSREKLVSDARPGVMIITRMLLGVVPFWSLYSLGDRHAEASSLQYPVGTLAVLVGWFITELLLDRGAHATLAKLVAAERLELAKADGRVGTCVATVLDDNAVRVSGHKAAMGVETTWEYHGRQGHSMSGAKFIARKSFIVEHAESRAEIDPTECVWATTVDDSAGRNTRYRDYTAAEWIPVNAQIALFGRFALHEDKQKKRKTSKVLRLESIGTQPAIVFATDAPGGPLREASRILWKRRVTLIILASSTVVAIALVLRGA